MLSRPLSRTGLLELRKPKVKALNRGPLLFQLTQSILRFLQDCYVVSNVPVQLNNRVRNLTLKLSYLLSNLRDSCLCLRFMVMGQVRTFIGFAVCVPELTAPVLPIIILLLVATAFCKPPTAISRLFRRIACCCC